MSETQFSGSIELEIGKITYEIYPENTQIDIATWDKYTRNRSGGGIPIIQDTQGRLWLGLGTRDHGDLKEMLLKNGIQPDPDDTTQLELTVGSRKQIIHIAVPHALDIDSHLDEFRIRRILIDVPPQRVDLNCLVLDASSGRMGKILGKDEYFRLVPSGDIPDLPNFKKLDPWENGLVRITYRIPNFPSELRR